MNENTAAISPERDAFNIRRIHSHYQMRIAFRRFYPSDSPNSFAKNSERFQEVLNASPEVREALAEQLHRRVRRQAIVVGSALLLLGLCTREGGAVSHVFLFLAHLAEQHKPAAFYVGATIVVLNAVWAVLPARRRA